MASSVKRRPLPALIGLTALLVLAAVVWLRVLHRSDSKPKASGTPCPTSTRSVPAGVALPNPSTVSIQVLNATGKGGLAGRTQAQLQADGFAAAAGAGNDAANRNKIKASAVIRFGPAAKAGATLLRYYIPGAVLTPVTTRSATVVISLGNGFRSLATKEQVAAALKADHITVSGAPSAPASPSSSASPSC